MSTYSKVALYKSFLTLPQPITSFHLSSSSHLVFPPFSHLLIFFHSFLIHPSFSLYTPHQSTMATTSSFHPLHQSPFLSPLQSHSHPHRLSLLHLSPSPPPSLSLTTAFSLLTPTTSSTTSFDALAAHLSAADFRSADAETRRLLIALAGDAALRRGYVFFSEVQFISPADLRAIDELWRAHSAGRFGYSVQKRVWEKKAKRDFTQFFIRVGWMKKLDTPEVDQWNYRSFPDEFMWEVKEGEKGPPEGHLPLTNALRGTQLLASILTHPAFEEKEEGSKQDELEESDDEGEGRSKEKAKAKMGGNRTSLKTDYSF